MRHTVSLLFGRCGHILFVDGIFPPPTVAVVTAGDAFLQQLLGPRFPFEVCSLYGLAAKSAGASIILNWHQRPLIRLYEKKGVEPTSALLLGSVLSLRGADAGVCI